MTEQEFRDRKVVLIAPAVRSSRLRYSSLTYSVLPRYWAVIFEAFQPTEQTLLHFGSRYVRI